jgi:FMN phosphatase YigB (HAD superfamily)
MGCRVRQMNSWDCFDTLVARRFVEPYTVFEEVGKRLGIEKFSKLRRWAEKNSDKTYEGIYKNLPGVDSTIEFQVELEHCFGIVENINRVQDGDIIVSDMYLSENQIRQILTSCGLNKDVKIFVTSNGKHNGTIWSSLPKKIDLHIGDNYRSDVESPRNFGINSEHYVEHKFNDIEQFVSEYDYNLACWMRYVRLKCPYTAKDKLFWLDQSNLNLPVLALASLELPNKPIAFTYRDSIYWHPMYEAITGKKARRLDVSRACYYNPTPEFTKYVLNQTKDHVIVDLQGSGKSLKSFFKNSLPEVIYICGVAEDPFICLERNVGDSIERHNCSNLGPLVGWDHNGPIRIPCENDPKIIEIQSLAMNVAIQSASMFQIKKNKELFSNLIWRMRKNFTWKNVSWSKTHNEFWSSTRV